MTDWVLFTESSDNVGGQVYDIDRVMDGCLSLLQLRSLLAGALLCVSPDTDLHI